MATADAVKWTLYILWAFTVLTLVVAMAGVISQYIGLGKQIKVKKANSCFSGFAAARVLLTAVIVLAIIMCITVVVLIFLQVVVSAAMGATSVGAKEAVKYVQELLGNGQGVDAITGGNFNQALTDMREGISSVISDLRATCQRSACDESVKTSAERLQSLQAIVSVAQGQLGTLSGNGRCNPGCLDLSLLWFLKSTKCLCDATTLKDIGDVSESGLKASIHAAIAIAVCFLFWLLFLSKTSMDLKAILRDAIWSAEVLELKERLRPNRVEEIYIDDETTTAIDPRTGAPLPQHMPKTQQHYGQTIPEHDSHSYSIDSTEKSDSQGYRVHPNGHV